MHMHRSPCTKPIMIAQTTQIRAHTHKFVSTTQCALSSTRQRSDMQTSVQTHIKLAYVRIYVCQTYLCWAFLRQSSNVGHLGGMCTDTAAHMPAHTACTDIQVSEVRARVRVRVSVRSTHTYSADKRFHKRTPVRTNGRV